MAIDRREFLKDSLLGCGALMLPTHIHAAALFGATDAPLKIEYIRDKIPEFAIPAYRGHTYVDSVPDTLDLTERAKLGVNVLTGITDPNAEYEIYWLTDIFRDPPIMLHDFNDWVQNQEGLMEALPLLRNATGSDLNSQVDPFWMRSILKSIGPDGLLYLPLKGRPWSRIKAEGVDPVWRADGSRTSTQDPSVSQIANLSSCERAIGTMTLYHARDGNPIWKTQIEKMIARLSELSIDRGDFCYFAAGSFEPYAKVDPNSPVPLGSLWGVSWNTRGVQALSQYYRATGYEPALHFASKLTNYTRYHGEIFDRDGRWLLDPEIRGKKEWRHFSGERFNVDGLTLGGHGQGHAIGLLSILEYAAVTKDRELLEFCRKSYEWGTNPGPEYGVSKLVGWFPEWYVPGFTACESCTNGDLFGVAVKLTESGAADYWDDIDRFARNHFAEAQLTKSDWIYKMAEQEPKKAVASNETSDRVPEKNIGGWSGWADVNEWARWRGIQHCCTGNAARGLYYVWEHMIDHQGEDLRVNLLMNRASRWADVYSYVPYKGQVDLKIKESCRTVHVRAPEWIESGNPSITCKVNGNARPLHWDGRYVNAGAVKAGDKLEISFPISERTVREKIGPNTYTLVLKGSTVVSIDPPGKNGPLYTDRAKYRGSEVAWNKVTRFVPEQEILW
ncbi:MAG: hypothetical protein WB787_16635 [Candidatus Acidiferrales bacterium]